MMVSRLPIRFVVFVFSLFALTTAGPGAAPGFSAWSAPINLGSLINGLSTDAGPCLSKDGLTLYFNSTRAGGFGDNDIWVSRRARVDLGWSAPVNIGAPVNTGAMEAVPVLSRDEHWLFFNSNRAGGKGNNDLWASYRENIHDEVAWGEPVNLGDQVNSTAFDVGASFFENDEAGIPMLFFTSSRPGGLGSFDIYVTSGSGSDWPGPVYPVPELNSEGNDQKPSIRFDGLEVFFQSDRIRADSVGGADLWVSTRETVAQSWSDPVNLGRTVNSASIDQQPFIAADRETLYFASNRPGGVGGLDIWMTTRTSSTGR
jgi:hypothetical protein